MTAASYSHQILARAAGSPVEPGAIASLEVDRAVISGARGPATLAALRDQKSSVPHPDNVFLAMDFLAPEVESIIPRSRALCREVAEQHKLTRVFDLNMGIGSHVAIESGHVIPGTLVAGSGRCLGVVGGVGAYGVRLDEVPLAETLAENRMTAPVPHVVTVDIAGRAPRYVGPWDVAVAVRRQVGKLDGAAVEFAGTCSEWSVDFRIALCGFLTEFGAANALVPADAVVAEFYRERGIELSLPEAPKAKASHTLKMDALKASYAATFAEDPREFAKGNGKTVQGAFVGSCYGGRYEDLARVAEVLKRTGRVAPGVRLGISPATLETARASLMAGFTEIFLQAGAMVGVPGGGAASTAGSAMFGEGETIASTAEYKRQLEPGQGEPEVWIMSPAAAAVAAAGGALQDPEALFS